MGKYQRQTSQDLDWGEPGAYKIVSSAKKVILKCGFCEKLMFMFNVNGSGPRINPCGSPFLRRRELY